MNFLPDLFVPCPVCEGRRFNRQTLAVRYKGLSIADVLDLPIDEAASFFENFPAIHRVLDEPARRRPGLPDARPVRRRRSAAASRSASSWRPSSARIDTGQTLYLLDEPTTGLHFDDIRLLARRACSGWSIAATR